MSAGSCKAFEKARLAKHRTQSCACCSARHAELLGSARAALLVVSAGPAVHVMSHAAFPSLLATCPKGQHAAVHKGCAVD